MSGPVPPDVVSLADYERHARDILPADVWAYIAGAGADGLTQARNREAFAQLELAGRVLADMQDASTATELFGRTMPFPLLLAPVAHQKLAHVDGELATALGTAACGAWMCVSTLASTSLEEIAAKAQAPLVFQLYFQAQRDATLELVRRAEAAGYAALMVTVDAPVNGVRNAEQRVGFRIPPDASPANVTPASPVSRAGPGQSPVFLGLLDHAPTWADLEWLRQQTTLPLIVKGIVHPDDADRAIAMGADCIAVSNHGGRTLDTLPASLDALRYVAARVQGRVPVLVDGGVRRGTDVLKALALGANAVMIGQPLMHALAVAGPVGVLHLLTILRAELEVAMALTGCASIKAVGPHVLWPPRPPA